ncbi:MAG: serine hydrolase [Burkholderiales bacterium]|nr:serine hydrolase [Burkholderiales bacterium]
MSGERTRRHVRRLLVGLAGLAVAAALLLAVSAVLQGPVTLYRMLAHGDTTIDDHRLYPFRPLAPSPHPHRFEPAPRADLERLSVAGAGHVDLSRWLEESATIALVVLKDERLLLERYLRGHDATKVSQAFSVSKSVLSMLVGAAIDEGLLRSVNDPVSAYVPELRERGFDRVRLVGLLTMDSGVDYVENDNPLGRHVRFNYTPHLREEILALKVKPGRDPQFTYRSGDSALLALVLERALARAAKGESITRYTQRRLWDPLGMEHPGLWSLWRPEVAAVAGGTGRCCRTRPRTRTALAAPAAPPRRGGRCRWCRRRRRR